MDRKDPAGLLAGSEIYHHYADRLRRVEPRRRDGIVKLQFAAQLLQFCIFNAGHHPFKAHRPPEQRGNDVGLIAVGQTKQKITIFGVHLAEDGRFSGVSMHETAVQFI